MQCKLCGLPTPDPPIVGDGHGFCCHGCCEVYRCFGDGVLIADQEAVRVELPPLLGREAYLWIEGMHCASCEFLISRIALSTPGIHSATSSYATSTARIVYDPDLVTELELPSMLTRNGYRARLRGDEAPEYDERQDLLRLLTGGILASAVMMMTLLFVYPIHGGFVAPSDYESIRWLAFVFTPIALFFQTSVLVFYVGYPILRGAWTGIRTRVLNMDCLIALSILSAYGYSVVQLFYDPIDLYFEVAGTLVAIITLGRFLEKTERVRATEELRGLLKAWVPQACVKRGGSYLICGLDELVPGERVYVRQGETLPVDGVIVDGQGAVNEALITGEPFPVWRAPGSKVRGGSVLLEGKLEIEAGQNIECRLEGLSRILWNTQSSIAGVQSGVDRLARVFAPAVIVLSVLVGLGFHIAGAPLEKALLASLATLIVSCPCTFGLAIPLTTAVAISSALRRGIVVSSADLFEKIRQIDIIVFDKTGTLSTGDMAVVDVIGSPEVVARAAAVERLSPHPVAEAIARLDSQRTASDFENHPGRGALASVGGCRVAVGSKQMFATLGWTIPEALRIQVASRAPAESVISYVGWNSCAEGAIITRDQPRPDWRQVIEGLPANTRVVLLTGAEDPRGYEDGVDEVHAGIPPEAKAAVIRRLKAQGTVAMVGDGSNDASALAEADLGIAFGAPASLAVEAADIVIPGNRLGTVLDALSLIGTTRRRIRQNLGWALAYNAVAIPLAMAGLLNPLFAALAMSGSSLLVVWNAVRPIAYAGPAGTQMSDSRGASSSADGTDRSRAADSARVGPAPVSSSGTDVR